MSRPYGRRPPSSGKQPDAPAATEIQVNITGRHTMEQLALEVQRALAMVEDYGATGLENFRFRLLPLDHDGVPVVLRDEQGQQVTVINIPDVLPQPAYRQNEPGVGIKPLTGPSLAAASNTSSPSRMRTTDRR